MDSETLPYADIFFHQNIGESNMSRTLYSGRCMKILDAKLLHSRGQKLPQFYC